MGRHGGQKRVKRLNTPEYMQIKRKHGKFFIKARAGPHPKRFSLPLLHIIRDILKIVETYGDAKKLITQGLFKIDGKVVKDQSYPVGLMDVLTIEKMNKRYRILPDSHFGLMLNEITEEESIFKLCRLNGKTTLKGGHVQLNLHDGRNILIQVKDARSPKEAQNYKRMDVLKISVPEQEILSVLKFKEGNLALIMDGKNIGQVGKVMKISKRFGPKASTVAIEQDNTQTETLYDYTFIIGEQQSEIALLKK